MIVLYKTRVTLCALAEEDTKSVVPSDSEEEQYYSEIEQVAASEEEMFDEPIEEHEQSMMALDEEYDEPAPEPSPSMSNVFIIINHTNLRVQWHPLIV